MSLAGDTIQGTGGLRKICIPLENTGKRGCDRVLYVDIELKETIYFVNVYTKNEKDDLTEDEKKAFKTVIYSMVDTLGYELCIVKKPYSSFTYSYLFTKCQK